MEVFQIIGYIKLGNIDKNDSIKIIDKLVVNKNLDLFGY